MLNDSPVPSIGASSDDPYVRPSYIWQYQVSDLMGRILTTIEVLGLPEKQEAALRSRLTADIWQIWDDAYNIPKEIMDEIFKLPDITQNKYHYRPISASNVPAKKKRRK